MRKQLMSGVAAAAATIMLVSGCSGDGDSGTADKSAKPSEPSIDVAALDVGKYPTSPRAPFGKVPDDLIIDWESQRMAQYMVVPFEVDSELTSLSQPTGVISGPNNLQAVVSKAVATVPANETGIISGFVSTFSTPDSHIRSKTSRAMNNWVGRYMTAKEADAAADQMAEAAAKEHGVQVTTAPGLPGTKLVASVKPGPDKEQVLTAFTSHRGYVLYQYYETTPKQKDMLLPGITKAVKLQSKLIEQFPRLATKDELKASGKKREPSIMDQDKVLIYALPYSDEEMKSGTTPVPSRMLRAVYGPRGMSLFNDDPASTFKMLSDVGARNNAIERSSVYRAKDDAGAKTILDSFVTQNKNSGEWKPAPSPKGLPIAPCFTRGMSGGKGFYTCYVQKGRYVGEVSSKDGETDAHQQVSAQYAILTKADQNAGK